MKDIMLTLSILLLWVALAGLSFSLWWLFFAISGKIDNWRYKKQLKVPARITRWKTGCKNARRVKLTGYSTEPPITDAGNDIRLHLQ